MGHLCRKTHTEAHAEKIQDRFLEALNAPAQKRPHEVTECMSHMSLNLWCSIDIKLSS